MVQNLNEFKYEYTVDQTYLLFEKSKEAMLETRKMDAIILAQSMIYTSPSSDQNGLDKKQKNWDEFIGSFNLKGIEKTNTGTKVKKKDPASLISNLASIGIKIEKKE